MKILIVNSLYYPNIYGGAEISVKLLSEELIKNGFKVVVISLHNAGDKIEYHNKVKVYYLHHRTIYFPFREKRQYDVFLKPFRFALEMYNPFIEQAIKAILKREKPDIVHTNNISVYSPVVWQIVHALSIPIVHTLRDVQLLCARGTMFKRGHACKSQCALCRFLSSTRKLMSKHVNAVVGITNFILNKHLSLGWFKNASKFVIPNSLTITSPAPPKRHFHKPLRFFYLGGAFAHKGYFYLNRTFSKLNNENAELWMAGRGDFKDVANHKNIKVLGYVKPEDVYPQVDVVIVPSLWYEAFGRIIIEANSFGIPVIGSNMGGIPELIEHGKTGFLFNPSMQNDLLKYIRMFIDNPDIILRLSSNCIKYSQKYTTEAMVKAYINVYKSMGAVQDA